jgi:hypothetical protein
MLGDLQSMGIDEEEASCLVRLGAETMLTELRSRPDAGEASSATAARIGELERELDQLPSIVSG